MIVKRSSSKKQLMLRQRPACSRHQSYVRWISVVHVATNQSTPPWPSHKPLLLETPTTTPSKNPHRLWHQSRLTPHPPEPARPPTRRLGERRKSINIWINSGTKVEKTLAPPVPSALTMRLGKTCPRSYASTVTRKSTTLGTVLSLEKTCQKISIGLGNFRSND